MFFVAILILGLLVSAAPPMPADAQAAPKHGHKLRKGPVTIPKLPTGPLGQPQGLPAPKAMSTVMAAAVVTPESPTPAATPAATPMTAACATPTIDLKILVVAADGKEADLPAIKQTLDFLGTPYTVFLAAPRPASPTTDRLAAQLASGCHAFYQGIILTTGSIVYFDTTANAYLSGLTNQEWQTLWSYEAGFGIRQVSWYTYPTPDYGFQSPTAAFDTSNSPIDAQFTVSGQSVFSYATTGNPLRISNAWAYLAKPADTNTTALLSDAQGNALAAVRSYSDGRQNLALTFDSNPNLLHSSVLAYGLINWVSKRLFLGERHVYLNAQVDDVFIDDAAWAASTPCSTPVDPWKGPRYRMTDTDLQNVLAWQDRQAMRLSLGFNGLGATGIYSPDQLTPAAARSQPRFNWISHTYTHQNLDTVSYENAYFEIQTNNDIAQRLGLTAYTPANLITPDVSGLTNAAFLQAAFDIGVRYLVTDTSQPGQNNPTPNAGIPNSLQPAIMGLPRHPTNLFFNVSAPDEWVAEYNCHYGSFWGRDLTYNEILDKESQVLLLYLLKGDIDPLMFHQTNLRAYTGTQSLLSDLLDLTLQKYSSRLGLPVLSLAMDDVGGKVGARMRYNAAGVTASMTPGQSITLTVQQAATIPVTGLNTADAETYGGQPIAHVALGAGQSVTLPLT